MKSIVLAEKPSVAREIARVLNCSIKKNGYFECPKYVVTWALGHLVTLAEPEDYDKKLKEWCMDDLPMLPEKMKLKVIKKTSHQFNTVKKLMQRGDIDELIIATDAGREGELVARWIMIVAGWKKPFKRLWISSQTDKAIREGFANLKPGREYDKLFDAAVCRAEADWLIGLNVTRALTCKFNAQLSAGRVQTPTLSMIIERENEIKNFKPKDYWTIVADFGDFSGEWRDSSGNSRIFDHAKVEGVLSKVKGHEGIVKQVLTDEKSELPPLAYDLTELQREANRKLGFSAQKTLSVLQDLYENHKIVTYPRTDSRYISSDIVPTLSDRLKAMAVGPYANLAAPLLQNMPHPGKRFVDNSKVSDHHAIIPTEQPVKLQALNSDERNLYDLIARRFISVLYPPYRFREITIITEINGQNFYSKGKVVKDLGWRKAEYMAVEKADNYNLPDQTLSSNQKGTKKVVKSVKANKLKTKPPTRYTEATLLTAMEGAGKFIEDEELRESIKSGGLGTPATRAEIIEKLIYSNYVERRGKELVPTSKGMQLINLVPPDLKSPELTAKWELKLSEIAKGKGSRREFMEGIRQNAAKLVEDVANDDSTFKADNITKTKCPVCGKYMLLINTRHGKMLSCPDRECGFRQPAITDETNIFKKSKQETYRDKRLIAKYSDNESVGNSLGDLLKAVLTEKKDN